MKYQIRLSAIHAVAKTKTLRPSGIAFPSTTAIEAFSGKLLTFQHYFSAVLVRIR